MRKRALRFGAAFNLALLLAVAGALYVWGGDAQEYTRGRVPLQFYRALEREHLLDDYADVFAIAHNSGDRLETTREAIDHNADVIEIDVVSIGDTLYAAHRSPLPWIGERLFQGPRLDEVWDEAAQVEVIKLDLKESSPRFVNLVLAFLAERAQREVVVVSRSVDVLAAFEERAPDAVRVLSVPSARQLDAVLADQDINSRLDGVSVAHAALTPERTSALREHQLLVFAFTVNDLERLNELVLEGVHAITTDNLAIMELLGGPGLGEARLRDLRTPAVIAAPPDAE